MRKIVGFCPVILSTLSTKIIGLLALVFSERKL